MNGADQIAGFREFLTTYTDHISALPFVGNLLLAAVLAQLLSYIYVRFGHSLSNRNRFASNFAVLTMTTMLIISIVKSSLALSLGLVGALSIVRFRSAIKEPEELMYLFLCIAVGLGLGANQAFITIVGCAIIVTVIFIKARSRARDENQNMQLTISSEAPDRASLDKIVAILGKHCKAVALRRVDETEHTLEASLAVDFSGVAELEACMAEFREFDQSVSFSFLDTHSS